MGVGAPRCRLARHPLGGGGASGAASGWPAASAAPASLPEDHSPSSLRAPQPLRIATSAESTRTRMDVGLASGQRSERRPSAAAVSQQTPARALRQAPKPPVLQPAKPPVHCHPCPGRPRWACVASVVPLANVSDSASCGRASSPVKKCQPLAAGARSYFLMLRCLVRDATPGDSFGSRLTVRMRNSSPTDHSSFFMPWTKVPERLAFRLRQRSAGSGCLTNVALLALRRRAGLSCGW